MGLIKAALNATSGVLADQWKEYFYCDAIPNDTLVVKGVKKNTKNNKGNDNVISNGSVIAVSEGQCMVIVDQGKIVEICAEAGEFTYDSSSEPSIFTGSLGKGVADTFANIGKRFTFGGSPAKDQRVYFINTKELVGNKYGTANPVPFRVVDPHAGIDMDIGLRCFGEYSYRITDPILFYTNVCGNVSDVFYRTSIDGQLKTEILTALQPAFCRISEMGIRYSSIPGHAMELADVLNNILSEKWRDLRGIEIVSFGVSSLTANEEDEKMMKDLQRNSAFVNPALAGAHMVGATADAMRTAAGNAGGAAIGFMGMNMANQAGGINTQALYSQAAQQTVAAPAMAADSWQCTCGKVNTGKFCSECGTKKPEATGDWFCPNCGTKQSGKFCPECGTKRP